MVRFFTALRLALNTNLIFAMGSKKFISEQHRNTIGTMLFNQ
jgi:hypothetical protein